MRHFIEDITKTGPHNIYIHILRTGHFKERTFQIEEISKRGQFKERHFNRGHFKERTFQREDNSKRRHFKERTI